MTQEARNRAVAHAVEKAPGSIRALARAAAVPPSTLTRIVSGKRAATLDLTKALARALREWSRDCAILAVRLDAAAADRKE